MDNKNNEQTDLSSDAWKEIPEYSLELVRDRSIKYRKVNAGLTATTKEMQEDAAAFLHKLLDNSPVEHFVALFVDHSNQVIGAIKVASGEVHKVQVDIRNLFRAAIAANADGIIVAHNHPMGEARPSRQDIMLTTTAIEVGQLLGVQVLDHIIVSPNGTHYSMWEHREVFEEELVSILKEEGRGLDVIGDTIAQLISQLPPPDVSGSLGTMDITAARDSAMKKSFPGGNPLAGMMERLGIKKPDGGGKNSN